MVGKKVSCCPQITPKSWTFFHIPSGFNNLNYTKRFLRRCGAIWSHCWETLPEDKTGRESETKSDLDSPHLLLKALEKVNNRYNSNRALSVNCMHVRGWVTRTWPHFSLALGKSGIVAWARSGYASGIQMVGAAHQDCAGGQETPGLHVELVFDSVWGDQC